jgi:DMSO/TMAO reductase YedYZ molybdopterin-dependent catalytic subunit
VEGWTAVAEFTGVPLRSLAALAQADPKAGYVDFQ